MPLSPQQIQRIAGLELNALRAAEVLGEEFERASIPARGTPVYDVNGELLFQRLPLSRGRTRTGYADIAVHEAFGEPLLATSIGAAWNEQDLVEQGRANAARGRRGFSCDTVRFVAYSYPKLALQFLKNGAETLMLELYTWAEVPQAGLTGRPLLQPSNFERWSLLDELPADERRARTLAFTKRVGLWDQPAVRRLDVSRVALETLRVRDFRLKLADTSEIHYSPRDTDHHPCYELRGQQTNVWCVAASVEMVLNFYRYTYGQVRVAGELGLGTLASPNGLPYSRVADVVTVMERLTSNAVDTTMHTSPAWDVFRDEIRANRPLVSFVPGHSRSVAGYTRSVIALANQIQFRGLLVYDPWPPGSGVITRWENFATNTYQYAYSSVLSHI